MFLRLVHSTKLNIQLQQNLGIFNFPSKSSANHFFLNHPKQEPKTQTLYENIVIFVIFEILINHNLILI